MALESASWITQLVATNPVVGDPVGEGDDHLRMLKTVLQNSFPSSSTSAVIPNMSGQGGKYLYTDGTDTSWVEAGSGLQISTTAPVSPSAGDMWWNSETGKMYIYYTDATPDSQWVQMASDGAAGATGPMGPKSISLLYPALNDQVTMFYTTQNLVVSQISSAVQGGTSVAFVIYYATNRNEPSPTTILSNTCSSNTGDYDTTFTNGTIPANNWVWLNVGTVTGTVTRLDVSMDF